MSFEKYKDYKDTGVLWIERIPSHWLPLRLKHACLVFPSNVDKKSYEDQIPVHLCNYTDVYYNEKIVSGMDFMKATATQEQIEKFTLKAGDTIITKDSETADDIGISAFVPNDIPGVICGYHLSMVRPKSCSVGNYVKYFFTSHFAKSKLAVAANGLTRVGLSQYSLDNIYFPTPSIEEQFSIANFLDHETAKIDSLITEQEKLIELLKEKRQAVISNAVTKGLDPEVRLKDSGVEWLGEVPAHWEVTKIKYIATASNGLTYSPDDLVDSEEGVLVLRSSNIQQGKISLEDNVYVKMNIPSKSIVKSGDILICSRNGSRALIGKNALIPDSLNGVAYGAFMMLLRSDISRYIYWILNSFIFKFQSSLFLTSTINQLTVSDLYGFEVPIPPKSEQVEIIRYLQDSTTQINSLIEKATKSIALLQERRTALISAAVTGQIDVRNYQPKEIA